MVKRRHEGRPNVLRIPSREGWIEIRDLDCIERIELRFWNRLGHGGIHHQAWPNRINRDTGQPWKAALAQSLDLRGRDIEILGDLLNRHTLMTECCGVEDQRLACKTTLVAEVERSRLVKP